MDDDVQPTLDVHQDGNAVPSASIDAVTSLIHSFAAMMAAMERRISEQIRDNSVASKDRWASWEADFREYRTSADRRIEIVEIQLDQHLAKEHDEELILRARVKPVTTAAQLVARHWKTILLVVFVILGLLGFATETLRDTLGMPL